MVRAGQCKMPCSMWGQQPLRFASLRLVGQVGYLGNRFSLPNIPGVWECSVFTSLFLCNHQILVTSFFCDWTQIGDKPHLVALNYCNTTPSDHSSRLTLFSLLLCPSLPFSNNITSPHSTIHSQTSAITSSGTHHGCCDTGETVPILGRLPLSRILMERA